MFSKHVWKVFILFFVIKSQGYNQTVGTILNTQNSSHNLTLIVPNSSKITYLIDICGRVVNQWESDYKPGLASYLDQDGNLYRAGRISSPVFSGGGLGGIIEKFNWEGDLIWQLDLSNDTLHQHHDFAVMPNGNIMAICWEYISPDEAIQNGRDLEITGDGIWPTLVLEIEYVGDGHFDKVWEWRAWDHIVQNHDQLLPNYGIPSLNKRKIDVNLIDPKLPKYEDWLHMNSIDYNPELDRILLSSRNLSEIYIIDHGTTMAESQGSIGGKAGYGGDLLYRFGNKNNFLSGENNEKILSNQHDANWIEEGRPGMGNIILFNNKPSTEDGFSEVLEFNFESIDGDYHIGSAASYESKKIWEYNSDATQDLYSRSMSGCQRLMNGNTLIISGIDGTLIETENNHEMTWKYVVPVNASGAIAQFDFPQGNSIFKARSYSKSFFNFPLNLEDNFKIEIDPTDDCMDFDLISSVSIEALDKKSIIKKIENGVEFIDFESSFYSFSVSNLMGQIIYKDSNIQSPYSFYDHDLTNGLYFINLYKKSQLLASVKYLK